MTMKQSLLFLLLFPLSLLCAAQPSLNPQRPASCYDDSVKVGLALSGGAAKGYAHLGLLQALDEANVRIDVISGTSMGAIVGLFYAAGYSPRQIVDIAKTEGMHKLGNIVKSNHKRDGGYADYQRLRRIIYKYMPHNCFDSLHIPFYCCATDLNNICAKHVGRGGYLAQYVTASASFPFVFAPVRIEGVTYVDGGVMDNLPVEPLYEEGCSIRIGSYFMDDTVTTQLEKRNEIWLRTISVLVDANTYDRIPFFTHIVPINPHGYGQADFSHIDDLFQYGYEAGQKLLQEHPELLDHKRDIKVCPVP